jgi:P4 family phage/plasmid primase-like protien
MRPESILQQFLNEVKTSSDPAHTHVSLSSPRGAYSVGSKMKTFWELYTDVWKSGFPLHLAENPGKETPILVDVDLRVKKSSIPDNNKKDKKLYSDEQLKAVISAYQKAINDVVNEPRVDAFTCVVLEKNPYEVEICGEKYIKNGFHLHFPKIFLDKKVQEVYIIPIAKSLIRNLFENLGGSDFIDANVTNVHWLLYGSSKSTSSEPYKATRVFLENVQETTFEKALHDYECNQYHEKPIKCKGRVLEMLPRILSIFLYNRERNYFYHPKPSVVTPLLKDFQKVRQARKEYDQLSVDSALEEATVLINMIDPNRSDDRVVWLHMGFCLWQLSQGDDEGLTMWLEFSENSDKFNESECFSMWRKMRPNNYTIGTLKFWAKKDNPDEYNKLVASKTKNLVVYNDSHNDYAKALHIEYGNEFVCSSIANKEWYQFKNHIWRPIDHGKTLRERISSQEGILLTQIYEAIEKERNETKINETKIKNLNKKFQRCKSVPFKNQIMIECQEVFYKENFNDLVNKDPNLVAFENGVYDFTNDVFRDGQPEDYLSVCIPVEYKDFGSVDHPRVKMIDDFFQKIFPDPEIRDYFLDEACRCFVGGNFNKVVLFWTGSGDNGKTITQTLFEKMLGKLAIKFSTTLITGKKVQVGGPNPEMSRASNGVRWAVMDEPNADEVINSGILKWLTGNDTFWARDLFQKGKDTKEITPLFKLHMICNNLPSIQGADKATWNRIRVIPFESTFVPENEAPQNYEDQVKQKLFPVDPNFADKLPKMTQPLAWYLIQRWRTTNSRNGHFTIPEKVKVCTDKYRRNNDVFHQFNQQCVFHKAESVLSCGTLYSHFKEWFKEEIPNGTVPTRSDVRHYFSSLWGEPVKGRYWADKTCVIPDDCDSGVDSVDSEPSRKHKK